MQPLRPRQSSHIFPMRLQVSYLYGCNKPIHLKRVRLPRIKWYSQIVLEDYSHFRGPSYTMYLTTRRTNKIHLSYISWKVNFYLFPTLFLPFPYSFFLLSPLSWRLIPTYSVPSCVVPLPRYSTIDSTNWDGNYDARTTLGQLERVLSYEYQNKR